METEGSPPVWYCDADGTGWGTMGIISLMRWLCFWF